MLYITEYQSPVGLLTIAADGSAVTGLWMAGQKYFGSTLKEDCVPCPEHPLLQSACLWLDSYFKGKQPSCGELPLAPAGSKFRQTVFRLLCDIPYGEVTTYRELARQTASLMGVSSMSSQAVGGAVGHNPISILIPCHRVVGSNGSLTGYAGGLRAKRTLLALEGIDVTKFW